MVLGLLSVNECFGERVLLRQLLLLLLLLLLHLVLAYTALCSIELGFGVLPVHAPSRAGWDLRFGGWDWGRDLRWQCQ